MNEDCTKVSCFTFLGATRTSLHRSICLHKAQGGGLGSSVVGPQLVYLAHFWWMTILVECSTNICSTCTRAYTFSGLIRAGSRNDGGSVSRRHFFVSWVQIEIAAFLVSGFSALRCCCHVETIKQTFATIDGQILKASADWSGLAAAAVMEGWRWRAHDMRILSSPVSIRKPNCLFEERR